MADVDEKTASSAETVGSIDDLLLEIFRRVPASENDDRNPLFKLASEHLNSQASYYYPLVGLRLVSRRWNSLISNNFPRNLKPFPAAGLIFVCPSVDSFTLFLDKSISSPIPFRKINDDPWHGRSKVVHSCNGLLLCASKRARRRVYSVCNPTTGKRSTLPPVDNKTIHGAFLAFDPCRSRHYKVVCVLGSEDIESRYCQFVVYSSETGSWGKCGEPFEANSVRFGNGVYWNGAIHWVGSSQLFCFDPDGDDDREVRLPMPTARHRRYYFGESCGHLHYVGLDDGVNEVVVHEMGSGYSGWAVKYKFDVSNAVKHSAFEVYAVVRGERDEDMFLVLGTSFWWYGKKKIVRFNHDGTFETIHDFDGFQNHLQVLEIPEELYHPFHYIESLASV